MVKDNRIERFGVEEIIETKTETFKVLSETEI